MRQEQSAPEESDSALVHTVDKMSGNGDKLLSPSN